MNILSYRNLTNLYTKTSANNVSRDFKKILEHSRDAVCGIEVTVRKGEADFTLVSPSFVRQNATSQHSQKNHLADDSGFYEGYLHEPFFLPLCTTLNGELVNGMQSLAFILNDYESVFIQWLFKRASNWKEKAVQMYSSYIFGNDYPFTLNVARKVQEKLLSVMNKLGAHVEARDYIEEAENKIINTGYCFKFNVVIDASTERQKHIINKLESLLNQYAYFNTIKLAKVKGKNIIQQINDCTMTPDSKYQILSLQEILSLFGGNDVLIIEDDSEENKAHYELQKTVVVNDVIELLPDYPMQEVIVREGLIHDIGESLKRVGITSQARVYNHTLTTGIRLTVVQFDIPKEKNLTHLTNKQVDIQAALGVNSLSIEQGDAPDTVRMLIPNEKPAIISLRSLLESDSFKQFCKENELAFVVGVDEVNNPILLSLAKLPHLLISGTTGSGKSVFLNQLAITLLLTNSPDELQMIMIDPKMVELQQYEGFPHVREVVTDVSKAERSLADLADEMDKRYGIFKDAKVRTITAYNDKVRNRELDGAEIIPYMVCVIDEYADLRDTNPDVELSIARLGQKARAAGIHVILCTQRPSVEVINGRIKSNMLNAISFNLGNTNNYRTVFGTGIPYTLLGKGDGCMKIEGWSKEFQRFQSPMVSPDEKTEQQVYEDLAEYLSIKYKKDAKAPSAKQIEAVAEPVEDDEEIENNDLYRLKQIIAATRETRTSELRKLMGIKGERTSNLIKELLAEGFLEAGKTKAEGNKINEEKFNEWMKENQLN